MALVMMPLVPISVLLPLRWRLIALIGIVACVMIGTGVGVLLMLRQLVWWLCGGGGI